MIPIHLLIILCLLALGYFYILIIIKNKKLFPIVIILYSVTAIFMSSMYSHKKETEEKLETIQVSQNQILERLDLINKKLDHEDVRFDELETLIYYKDLVDFKDFDKDGEAWKKYYQEDNNPSKENTDESNIK